MWRISRGRSREHAWTTVTIISYAELHAADELARSSYKLVVVPSIESEAGQGQGRRESPNFCSRWHGSSSRLLLYLVELSAIPLSSRMLRAFGRGEWKAVHMCAVHASPYCEAEGCLCRSLTVGLEYYSSRFHFFCSPMVVWYPCVELSVQPALTSTCIGHAPRSRPQASISSVISWYNHFF